MVRVATLIMLDGAQVFGAAGASLVRFLGGETLSLVLLVCVLALWVVGPLFVAARLLERQDI
jgi:hypothetical protein